MAIFQQSGTVKKDSSAFGADAPPPPAPARETPPPAVADFQTATPPASTAPAPSPAPAPASAPRPATPVNKESIIAADLTIEGKIEGTGDVRIAGRFKGDVNVQGNLTIEHGAKLNGGVRAQQVLVSGELEGNIESASLVELRDSAVLTGDLKAGSLTVASGSKIRGHIECGWGDVKPTTTTTTTGSAKDKGANDKSSD
ncbi:bactofilin family protein [Luteimonas terrae]|uniref:Cytoskeletal protein CcmA (Bactofilin family) n=1 Tax=Luteimonas terrae TaxID=1530191 RepID=A0ABU1XXW5_9GAMM|nr:polymer-forming cytoskeletal protein [Luteimonas terrae]MDR7192911.1 cytoskeletal protein CcmA (bactofilin family) [Luteimonas terrae]